jgi:serine/threonine-protein kinase RsbW
VQVQRLRVPGAMDALEPARRAMLAFLAPHGLSTRLLYKLELVLEETLMNRLWHAHPEGGDHHTELQIGVRAEAIELRFEDSGMAFNPLLASDPAVPASLVEASPGGLGLMLTRKAATRCFYERVGERNVFTVHLARNT